MSPPPRNILFLQSHPSGFARRLASAFEKEGCRVLRVNFCVGDALYWLGRPALNFRGSLKRWPEYLRDLIRREQVSDILCYGDGRAYHRLAMGVAAELGLNGYVYEFGYLRPDWITLERGGMSSRSHFPNDPDLIRTIGAQFSMPDMQARTRFGMTTEMTHEMTYHLSSYFLHLAYPRYAADRYYNPIVEYLTGMKKQLRDARMQREAKQIVGEITASERPYFLMPLQLQCDYQLRHHSPYAHQGDAIREVIASFAAHASADASLVFKCHPLDNGAENWPAHIAAGARDAGIADERLIYIEGGDLGRLLANARGAVMINSTVGMHALIVNCPVKLLGTAVFDIAGLSHQESLHTFWQSPQRPDKTLVEALIRAMAGTIQVRGDFFTRAGQDTAIATFVERILNGSVNSSGAFVDPPPRLHSTQSLS